MEKYFIILISIQIILSIYFFFYSKDTDDKIVLKKNKLLKGCFEKWTYLNGIPIGFQMIWSNEVEAYFNKIKKEQEKKNKKKEKTKC